MSRQRSVRTKRLWCMAAVLASLCSTAAQGQDMPEGSEVARRAIHVCAACHGEGGRSTQAGTPSLAGQPPQYLITQLKDFRSQTRSEAGTKAYMWGVSALLDDATITALASYYAAQPTRPGPAAPAAALKLGQRLFSQGDPARGIRDCANCHGDEADGAAAFPRLAGQRADYLLAQLQLFSTRLRPHGVLMQKETRLMTTAEMRAMALFLQSLP